jgi:D-glycero-D-manno-heptose 1,7-bisphosphate phosphatase
MTFLGEKNFRKMTIKTVILDRDGTVIVDKDYLCDPALVELLPGAAAGMRALAASGLRLVLVTNQSGVGRGMFTLDEVAAVNAELVRQLKRERIRLDGIYICPHAPGQDCDCRKPRPGLVLQAARELGFEPSHSVVIGDKLSDLGLGRAVGAVTVLVRTGYGAGEEARLAGEADIIADNLEQAAAEILKLTKEGAGA